MPTETETHGKPNRLIHEKSPYLLQHAYNPVDWYPWGPEALTKAKAENKPIFLSIGYASCHWCHVMEKECFEDEEVAKLLNDTFICIKVDREERPDLDAAYMAVCQAMGRSCGWPLNVMLTPTLNAFFAASYIPKVSNRGMMGMMQLILQVAEMWRLRRRELEIVGADMRSRIEEQERRTPENELGKQVFADAYEMLDSQFDAEDGGFGGAPKFPRAQSLLFLLRYWKRSGEKNALAMVEKTLAKMRQGGVYDQLGFGFHRYSTDAKWLVPHFEKMLYDQAWLTLAFVEAFQATGARRYAMAAKEIITYVQKDLASPKGAFYSGQDADTNGEEGKYYLWTLDEVFDALPTADAELAAHVFGLKTEGNFPDQRGEPAGKNVLHFAEPLEELAPYKGLTLEELIEQVHSIRNALFEARKKRVAPATDDKVLTDWNGMMIAALARAGWVLGEKAYVDAARKAADFLLTKMKAENGTLFHRYAKGERAVEGFLDDYAFLAFGLTELYEATFDDRYLQEANALTKAMVAKFWDQKNGGFYLTPAGAENPTPRLKQVYDGAAPSGNSVALMNLVRLSRFTTEPTFDEMTLKLTKAFSNEVQAAPEGYAFMLCAIDFLLGPTHSVIVVGSLGEKDTQDMLEAIRKEYLPNLVVAVREPEKAGLGYEKIDGKATAYVCKDQMCLPPTYSVATMLELLRSS